MKVAILGYKGMLGSAVREQLSGHFDLTLVDREEIDVSVCTSGDLQRACKGCSWVVNCIGMIKPHIDDVCQDNVEMAIRVNALFPHKLSKVKAKIIQIETDCVFSGDFGGYKESDIQDPKDVYGKTKSLGEVNAPNVFHVRCSIVGFDKGNLSLLSWFLSNPKYGAVCGYDNQWWNGVTVDAFGKMCRGVIENDYKFSGIQHFVPLDKYTKAELIKLFIEVFRPDLRFVETSKDFCDRTLKTEYPDRNRELWKLAGYNKIPSIEKLIKELK